MTNVTAPSAKPLKRPDKATKNLMNLLTRSAAPIAIKAPIKTVKTMPYLLSISSCWAAPQTIILKVRSPVNRAIALGNMLLPLSAM